MILKYLVTGLVLYFMYKFMFGPSLNQGAKQKKGKIQEDEIEIRKAPKGKKDRGEFIDYEEVD